MQPGGWSSTEVLGLVKLEPILAHAPACIPESKLGVICASVIMLG
jgi:hypothetical protein